MKEQNQHLPQHTASNHHVSKVYNSTRRMHQSYTTHSNNGSDGYENSAPLSMGGTSGTLVDQLQIDNEKLQRDLHAQTSMLTSRNRENNRLREENEGLKLTIRRGEAGSVAGDSILERSISRNHIRSVSRASGGTRITQISDPDREDLEAKYAVLRDELSQTKLDFKELDEQLNGHLDMLETAENKVLELERDLEINTEDLQALQAERDDALAMLQDKEQECEELEQEAVQRLDQIEAERLRLQNEKNNIEEDYEALQQELKNASDYALQLEDERDANLRKIQNLEAELADANEELNRQDKLLTDERSRNERLDVQMESCQGEIDFLREEQEGDKIKIGDLESALNHAQIALQDEKTRARDLNQRIEEERQQRDVLENREKREVEKVINELNGQLTKLKEDSRRLRKNLSSKEVEASAWRQRHDELEAGLREVLSNPEGSKANMFNVSSMRHNLTKSTNLLCRTSRNFDVILMQTCKHWKPPKQNLPRRIDYCAIAILCLRILVWKAVAWQNC